MINRLALFLLIPTLGCAMSVETVVEHSADKVVKVGIILADGRHAVCSGAYIDQYGTVLTCAHCLSHAGIVKVFIKNENEDVVPAIAYRLDKKADLALILTDPKSKTSFFRMGRPVKRGQEVVLCGSPLGMQHTVSIGYIENFRKDIEGIDHSVIVDSAATNPGNSGGPLVDLAGRLVGVGEGELMSNPFVPAQGLGFAVSLETIKSFLEGK
jgi:serine protease Do